MSSVIKVKYIPMKKTLLLLAAGLMACSLVAQENKLGKPNVVLIYADDLGIGDVGAYGGKGLKTPNMDKIARQGVLFTNAYATSATCTPSRYSLLTGDYPWRNKRVQVLSGDAPLLISTDQVTLPKMMKNAGYRTAVVGKWHLGMGNGNVDWNQQVSPGAKEVGFDYSFIMAATNDRVPNVFVENGSVVGLDPRDPLQVSYQENFEGEPTGRNNPDMLKMKYSHGHDMSINNGVSRIGFQKGGKSAQWIDEDMADTFLGKSQDFVKENVNNPFFLFYALHEPHVPRVPNARFAGTTGLGPRGDAIAEADWCIGELLKTLENEGLLENTIVIFSSDNGPVLDDGYRDEAVEKLGEHSPAGIYRGGKYSLYEAGTKIPFVLMWKNHIPSQQSDALICQVDILASMAALTNQKVPESDSRNLLDVFLGENKNGRDNLIVEGLFHRTALRSGDWVFIPAYQGGKTPGWGVDVETGFLTEVQLFDIRKDPRQRDNLATKYPKKVKAMKAEFEKVRK
jgi:arylsulfatase A-like enzyme